MIGFLREKIKEKIEEQKEKINVSIDYVKANPTLAIKSATQKILNHTIESGLKSQMDALDSFDRQAYKKISSDMSSENLTNLKERREEAKIKKQEIQAQLKEVRADYRAQRECDDPETTLEAFSNKRKDIQSNPEKYKNRLEELNIQLQEIIPVCEKLKKEKEQLNQKIIQLQEVDITDSSPPQNRNTQFEALIFELMQLEDSYEETYYTQKDIESEIREITIHLK